MRPLFNMHYGRAFERERGNRVLVLYEPTPIGFSQVYPFLLYARAFAERHDAQFRFVRTPAALDGLTKNHREATHVLVQTRLTDPPEKLVRVRSLLSTLPWKPRLVYLDSFANADIRLAHDLPEFDLYFKKSLFIEPANHLRATEGHTNLTEYYGRLYGLDEEVTDWKVSAAFLPRLRLSPNFLTAPYLATAFLDGPRPPPQDRQRRIDLHARFGGTKQPSWYGEMRRHAERAVKAISGVTIATGSGIARKAFLAELRASKICFSPFGYGELCWRDIEAIMTGAVLLKPDMSHLRTAPDLYRDGETYVAVKWDFSDLEEKVRLLLADAARREHIAATAWETAHQYLAEHGPVDAYRDIFELERQ